MVAPSTGAVVLLPFPFSDLSRSKLRPAVVLADAGRRDWILCQVTSNLYSDPRAVWLSAADFRSGSLERESYARPGKLCTANGRVEADGVVENTMLPLFDPQTSGGLLIAAPENRARELVRLLRQGGASAAVVGEVVDGAGVQVTV